MLKEPCTWKHQSTPHTNPLTGAAYKDSEWGGWVMGHKEANAKEPGKHIL